MTFSARKVVCFLSRCLRMMWMMTEGASVRVCIKSVFEVQLVTLLAHSPSFTSTLPLDCVTSVLIGACVA